MHRYPERFGVTRLRNADRFALAIPEQELAKLHLPYLDFDLELPEGAPDLTPLRRAVQAWQRLQHELEPEPGQPAWRRPKALYYEDGGDFLRVVDRRHGFACFTLEGVHRQVLLACSEITSEERLGQQFPPREVQQALDELGAEDLVYREGGRVLSLPIAAQTE